MSLYHKFLPTTEIHAPHSYIFENAAERAAFTEFVSTDLGKFAWQKDLNAVFMLVNLEPILWVPVGMIVSPGVEIESPSTDVENVISSTDLTLMQESKLTQNINMTVEGRKVMLPSSLPTTGLKFIVANVGMYSFNLQDSANSVREIKPGMYYRLYYTDTDTWEIEYYDATTSLPFFKCDSSLPFMTTVSVSTPFQVLQINATDIVVTYRLAVDNAVHEAAKTIHYIVGVEVTNFTANVNDGEIVEYRADVKLAFKVK